MKSLYLCLLLPVLAFAQSKEDLERRFNTYLNFRGSLSSSVQISSSALSILEKGQPEFTAYASEWPVLGALLQSQTIAQQKQFYEWKKNKHLSAAQIDSLSKLTATATMMAVKPAAGKKLAGLRIAIDPGHIAGNMAMARIEQKYLDFYPGPQNKLKDSVHIGEGMLTYNTAAILKQKLVEQGADVFVTRPQQNCSAFQMTYDDWLKLKKKKTLDSLLNADAMTPARHKQLMAMNKQKFFWEFFRDYELMERARIINNYKPDLSIVIHYNVDEKNTDWLNPSDKDYTMTFIGGGITADNLGKTANKLHLLRLLLSNQLDRSEKISSLTVKRFSENLGIPIARQTDADYLRDNCLKTPSAGVFCRNLLLCRTINSPLVYGECLYQDDEQECLLLNRNDYSYQGLQVPKRVYEVADCYYQAIIAYFSNQ